MKVAILLRGISYKESHTTSTGMRQSVDWNLTRDNIRANLIEAFPGADVYLSSYHSPEAEQVINYFQPLACVFHSLSANNRTEMDCLLSGLDLIRASRQTYDAVLISRFDLHYYQPVTALPFDTDKVNFLYREYSQELHEVQGKSANGLWLVSHRMLDQFHAACEAISQLESQDLASYDVALRGQVHSINPQQSTHYIHLKLRALVPAEAIHFVNPGYFVSTGARLLCPYYKVIRSASDIPEASDPMLVMLGHLLYTLRLNRGLDRPAIAALLGVSNERFDRLENGEAAVSLQQFLDLCQALKLIPWKVLEWLHEERPATSINFVETRLPSA